MIVRVVCGTKGCERRGVEQNRFVTKRTELPLTCSSCGARQGRRPRGPRTSVVERLDNGSMPQYVERPVEINEMIREHRKKALEE